MSRLCTICVRGGSKGVKGKNIRPLMGKPLLAHSIAQAKATGLFDAVVVNSDSEEILTVANQWGADATIRRPDELASDTAPKAPAILHCLDQAEVLLGRQFPIFVDLDATSPLRLPEDIIGAVRLLEDRGVSNVITGCSARRSPYFNLVETDDNGVVHLSKTLSTPVARRQDGPRCFDMNASIYVWRSDVFRAKPGVFYPDTLLFEMPDDRSVDIDSELDFEIVRLLMEKRTQGDM